jgi:hypothetical protein
MQAMLHEFALVFVLSLVASTTSVTLTKARVFRGLRDVVARCGGWLGDLARCPYCMSHWIAMLLVAVYRPRLTECSLPILDYVVSVFSIVAMATLWSAGICGSLTAMDALSDQSDHVH